MKINLDNHYEIIGVASTGAKSCCGQAMYTRISAFIPWILKNLEEFEDPHYEFSVTYEQIENQDVFYWMYYLQKMIVHLLYIIFFACTLSIMLPTLFSCNFSKFFQKCDKCSNIAVTIFLCKLLLQKVPYLVPLYVAYLLLLFKILITKLKTECDYRIFAIIRHMFKKLLFFFVRPVFKVLRNFSYCTYAMNSRPPLIAEEV